MKLASYIADGKPCFGVVTGDGVVTLNHRLGAATLRDALAAGALAEMRKATEMAKPDHKLGEGKCVPATPNRGTLPSAGSSYRSHAAATARGVPNPPRLVVGRAE